MENQRVHQYRSQMFQTVLRDSEVPIYSFGSNMLDLLGKASGFEKIIFVNSKNQILWGENGTERDSLFFTKDDILGALGQVEMIRSRGGGKVVDKMVSTPLPSIDDQPFVLWNMTSDEEDGLMKGKVFNDVLSSSHHQPVLFNYVPVYYDFGSSIDCGLSPPHYIISSRGGFVYDSDGTLVGDGGISGGGYGGDDRRGDDGGRNGHRRGKSLYAANLVRPKFKVSVDLEDWYFDPDEVPTNRIDRLKKLKSDSQRYPKYYRYRGHKRRHYGKKKLSPRQKECPRIFYYE